MPSTYLVTGASRGIGAELVRRLASRGDRPFATLRPPANPPPGAVRTLPLEVTDRASIDALARSLEGSPLDVLINNAGVSSPSATLALTTGEELARCFAINAASPVMVAKALLPNLRAGSRRLIVNVSTQLASITNNSGGSSYAYRASKTALNQLTVCMANELRADGFTVVAMHPGWVKTDMGGPKAPLSTEQAVAHILATIDRLTPADSGRFLNYDGGPMPW